MDTLLKMDLASAEHAMLAWMQSKPLLSIPTPINLYTHINWYTHHIQPMPPHPSILGKKTVKIIWDDTYPIPTVYPFKLKVPNSVFFMDHIEFYHKVFEGKDDTTILAFSTRSKRDQTMYRLIANGADKELVKPTRGKH